MEAMAGASQVLREAGCVSVKTLGIMSTQRKLADQRGAQPSSQWDLNQAGVFSCDGGQVGGGWFCRDHFSYALHLLSCWHI